MGSLIEFKRVDLETESESGQNLRRSRQSLKESQQILYKIPPIKITYIACGLAVISFKLGLCCIESMDYAMRYAEYVQGSWIGYRLRAEHDFAQEGYANYLIEASNDGLEKNKEKILYSAYCLICKEFYSLLVGRCSDNVSLDELSEGYRSDVRISPGTKKRLSLLGLRTAHDIEQKTREELALSGFDTYEIFLIEKTLAVSGIFLRNQDVSEWSRI